MKDHLYYRVRPLFEAAAPNFFTPRGTDPIVARHGINREVIALMQGTASATLVRDFLWRWFSRPEYLAAVSRGGCRHDLSGKPCAAITPEEMETARDRLVERLVRDPSRPGGPNWLARTLDRISADHALRAEVYAILPPGYETQELARKSFYRNLTCPS